MYEDVTFKGTTIESLRIPRKMGIDSTGSRALIPRHRGQLI
jgi:hypothetical protein